MIKHHPSVASHLKRFRKRKRKPIVLPGALRNYERRKEDAKLAANSALYDPPDIPTPEDILLAKEQTRTITRLIDRTIDHRHARVIALRYGLHGEPHTLDQVGEQFGVSRERIRQMEGKVLRQLRHPSRVKHLTNRYFARWHQPAQRNLYVPQWQREMADEIAALAQLAEDDATQQRILAAEQLRLRDHERSMFLRDRAFAELQSRIHSTVEAARRRALENPEHIPAYADALRDMLSHRWAR